MPRDYAFQDQEEAPLLRVLDGKAFADGRYSLNGHVYISRSNRDEKVQFDSLLQLDNFQASLDSLREVWAREEARLEARKLRKQTKKGTDGH